MISRPSRTIVSVAGVSATQPSSGSPAHSCVAIWLAEVEEVAADAVDRDQLVAGLQHRGGRRAGLDRLDASATARRASARKNRITNAITTFTNGPAAITTIRFQTGCA